MTYKSKTIGEGLHPYKLAISMPPVLGTFDFLFDELERKDFCMQKRRMINLKNLIAYGLNLIAFASNLIHISLNLIQFGKNEINNG